MKRLMDVLFSAAALVLGFPLMILIAILTRATSGRPILFAQVRPGLLGKPFKMYKFRTMTEERDETGDLLPDEKRLTRFGIFLRATSLDELPELFNVLRGDMSLVGPRPLLIKYLDRYTAHQARRHEVRPGITGWAQVNGRNAIDWERKFDLDVWYVENRSFGLDVRILWLTLLRVLAREGIGEDGRLTVREFDGNEGVPRDVAVEGGAARALDARRTES